MSLFAHFPTLLLNITGIGPVGAPDDQWNCAIRISTTAYAIPFMVHAGASPSYPQKCDCGLPIGKSPNCDIFNFTFGGIVYDYTKNNSVANKYPAKFRPWLPLLEFFYVQPGGLLTPCHLNSHFYLS